eukprot:scaffold134587_cov18-Tisochrysis_lutea.AAC.1
MEKRNQRTEQHQALMFWNRTPSLFSAYNPLFSQLKIASFSVDVQLYGYVTIYADCDDAGFIQARFEIEVCVLACMQMNPHIQSAVCIGCKASALFSSLVAVQIAANLGLRKEKKSKPEGHVQ